MKKIWHKIKRPSVYLTTLLFVLWFAFLFIMPTEIVRSVCTLIAGWQVGVWLRTFYEVQKSKE